MDLLSKLIVRNQTEENIRDQKFLDNILLLLIFIVYGLPNAIGFRFVIGIRILFFIPYLASIIQKLIMYIKKRIRPSLNYTGFSLFSFWAIIWGINMWRTAFVEINYNTFFVLERLVIIVIINLFIFLIFFNPDITNVDRISHLSILIWGYGLYFILNLLLYLLGVESDAVFYLAQYPSEFFSALGIRRYRILFPMASGINSFGVMASVSVSLHLPQLLIKNNKYQRLSRFILIFGCLTVILLTDSRGALIISILSIFFVLLFERRSIIRKKLIVIPFLISLIPIIVVFFFEEINEMDLLKRQESRWNETTINSIDDCENFQSRNGFLSNRSFIWDQAIEEISQPKMIHLVGYGFRGHFISNLSEEYKCLFLSYTNREIAPLHNLWLQIIIDLGYIGLIIFILFMIIIFRTIIEDYFVLNEIIYLGILGFFFSVISIGATESIISPDYFEVFLLFSLLSLILVVKK